MRTKKHKNKKTGKAVAAWQAAFVVAIIAVGLTTLPQTAAAQQLKNGTNMSSNSAQMEANEGDKTKGAKQPDCASCHKTLFTIGTIKELNDDNQIEASLPCEGSLIRIGESADSVDENIKQIERMANNIAGNTGQKKGGSAGRGNASPDAERDINIIVADEITRMKKDFNAYLNVEPPDDKTAAKEYGKMKKETDELYQALNKIYLQRRFKNMLYTSTAACLLFLFAVMIGYKKLSPR